MQTAAAQKVAASALPNARPTPSAHEKLVEQTQKWLGLTFFAPMLDEMRKDPFANSMFDGGRGGQAFSAMYDQELAQRMSRGVGNKLVNSIVNKIEAKSAYGKYALPKTGAAQAASDFARTVGSDVARSMNVKARS